MVWSWCISTEASQPPVEAQARRVVISALCQCSLDQKCDNSCPAKSEPIEYRSPDQRNAIPLYCAVLKPVARTHHCVLEHTRTKSKNRRVRVIHDWMRQGATFEQLVTVGINPHQQSAERDQRQIRSHDHHCFPGFDSDPEASRLFDQITSLDLEADLVATRPTPARARARAHTFSPNFPYPPTPCAARRARPAM